ncbi:hypothetical protein IQ249_16940 [Lusitaniella coriacea LEGE 07157]|uniref:Uncharacterized protein n=1 Tax=Lusitaniella coriacea LEGE 07157 TaxID=945747 RepID=A0A8J7DY93_9CYAN|nr:hypothetical protein [Lusitaniella coriacea]MBE9117586.1 hypothetical protein [Lusitaniella coriacea LEGE 07157]
MKLFSISPALIVALLLGGYPTLSPALARTEIAQSVWRLFASPQGDFTILMPGEPIATQATTNIDTVAVDIQGFVVQRYDDTVQYLVTRIEIPDELNITGTEPNQLLTAMQNQILSQTNGQLVEQSRVMLGDYPGQEMKLQTVDENDRAFVVINRIYWVDRQLYQLSVTVPTSLEPSLAGSSQGFLDSFKFVQN